MRDVVIEDPIEAPVTPMSTENFLFGAEAPTIFRGKVSIKCLTNRVKGNPAFKYWSLHLAEGEKLPRGKFFNNITRQRKNVAFINTLMTGTLSQSTVHIIGNDK